MAEQISTKKIAISKANAQMVGFIAAACFVSIFCLFASKAVWDANFYRAKVVSKKQKAHDQLEKNIQNYDSLKGSYDDFNNRDPNAIGGSKNGGNDNDGTNSKLILDALPSTYDFPALASSIEKIMADRSLKVANISGTDDQVNQQSNTSSEAPKEVPIPFSFTINNANYTSVQQLVSALQKSIRPIVIDTLTVNGGGQDMTIIVNAHTFYQPAKNLNVKQELVK